MAAAGTHDARVGAVAVGEGWTGAAEGSSAISRRRVAGTDAEASRTHPRSFDIPQAGEGYSRQTEVGVNEQAEECA